MGQNLAAVEGLWDLHLKSRGDRDLRVLGYLLHLKDPETFLHFAFFFVSFLIPQTLLLAILSHAECSVALVRDKYPVHGGLDVGVCGWSLTIV